jgi:hypothetical protein
MVLLTSSADGAARSGGKGAWAAAAQRLRGQGWPLRCVEVVAAAPDAERSPLGSSSGGRCDGSSFGTSGGGGGGGGGSDDSGGDGGRGPAGWEAVEDASGGWRRLHRGAAEAAVLVRPDGHVAWRVLRRREGGGGGGGGGGDGGVEGGTGDPIAWRAAQLERALAAMGWRPQQPLPTVATGNGAAAAAS